jgi:HEAT repeat protein
MLPSNTPLDTLLPLLTEGDLQTRISTAIHLANVRDERLIAPFMQLLADPDPTLRANALTGLGVNRAEQALPAMLPLLKDPNEIVRERAVTALAQIGTADVVEPILAVLDDPNRWVRNRAAYVLGASGDARAIDPLIELLDSRDASTVGIAAWSLGNLRARMASPILLKLLHHKEASVRGNAAWALGEMSDPSLVSPLIDLLKDKDPEVRGKTAWALGNLSTALGDTRMEKTLTRLLDDFAEVKNNSAHTFVAQYAAEALMQVGTETAKRAVEAWRPTAQAKLLPYRVREMIRSLAHQDANTREAAAQALIQEGNSVVPQVLEALQHKNARVRQGAARILGELQAANAIPSLLVGLADDDVGVWSQCVAALAKLPTSVLTLQTTLANTPKQRVKLGCAIALWRIQRDEMAFPYLLIAMNDAELVVQSSAITSLWKQPDERALATLQTLLTPDDTMLNRYILQALQAIGTPRALHTIRQWGEPK